MITGVSLFFSCGQGGDFASKYYLDGKREEKEYRVLLSLSYVTLKHAMIQQYQKKAVQTGNLIEVYEYARPIFRGLTSRFPRSSGVRTPKPRTMQSAMRTRSRIRRLVNSNPTMDKFLTLTFADNVQDVAHANYLFKLFRQKLERYIGRKFKYLGVVEFQERGAIHYHLIMDIPFIEWQILSDIWGNGRINVQRIKKPNRAGVYMAKTTGYMVKGLADTRLFGKRMYFYSYTTLDKVVEFLDFLCDNKNRFVTAVDRCKTVLFRRNFFIEGHGLIKYKLYAIS